MAILQMMVKGQTLIVKNPPVVSKTVNYIDAAIVFQTIDWDGLDVFLHFKKKGTDKAYIVDVIDGKAGRANGINLDEGTWEIWVHGQIMENDVLKIRITTEKVKLYVKSTGSVNGGTFPDYEPTIVEKLVDEAVSAKDAAKNYRDEAEDFATKAKESEDNASEYADMSREAESNASQSESEAKNHEDNAKEYANSAKMHAEDASTKSSVATEQAELAREHADFANRAQNMSFGNANFSKLQADAALQAKEDTEALKNETQEIVDKFNYGEVRKTICEANDFEFGALSSTDGSVPATYTTQRARTKTFYTIQKGHRLRIDPKGMSVNVFRYNEDESFVDFRPTWIQRPAIFDMDKTYKVKFVVANNPVTTSVNLNAIVAEMQDVYMSDLAPLEVWEDDDGTINVYGNVIEDDSGYTKEEADELFLKKQEADNKFIAEEDADQKYAEKNAIISGTISRHINVALTTTSTATIIAPTKMVQFSGKISGYDSSKYNYLLMGSFVTIPLDMTAAPTIASGTINVTLRNDLSSEFIMPDNTRIFVPVLEVNK